MAPVARLRQRLRLAVTTATAITAIGCGSRPRAPAPAASVSAAGAGTELPAEALGPQAPSVPLRIHPADWSLAGSASLSTDERPALLLHYCCVSASEATAQVTPTATTRARLTLDASIDCARGTTVRVRSRLSGRTLFEAPIDVVAPIMSRCPLEVTGGEPLELTLSAVGGISCCGTTTIRTLALEPVARTGRRTWSRRRCRWLFRGLDAANRLGGYAEVAAFVDELPP